MLLINIVPAIFYGLFTTQFCSVIFLKTYASSNINNFLDVLRIVFDGDIFVRVYPLIIIFSVSVVFFSLGFGVVERYLRIGKVTLYRPMSILNITFIPTLVFVLLGATSIFLLKLIMSSLIIIVHLITSGAGMAPALSITIVSVLSVVLPIVAIGLFLWLFLLLPTMTISGYTFMDSVGYSIRLAYKDFWSLFLSIIVPVFVFVAIEVGFSFLFNKYLMLTLRIVLFLFIFSFLQSFVMTTYDTLR